MTGTGDVIECSDFNELIKTMGDLMSRGIEADFSLPDDHKFLLRVVKADGEGAAGDQSQA